PQWYDAGRPDSPLAGHDLGPRLELGRRGCARSRRLSARVAARPTGDPPGTPARARRLLDLHVLGGPQHVGSVPIGLARRGAPRAERGDASLPGTPISRPA